VPTYKDRRRSHSIPLEKKGIAQGVFLLGSQALDTDILCDCTGHMILAIVPAQGH
jgi:hypothetical protein